MQMITALSVHGTALFRTCLEAQALWNRLVERVHLTALGLMPDHFHAKGAGPDLRHAVAEAMRAYTLWRNAHRGESGRVWAGPAEITPINGRDHERRATNYIHLNPCRAGLVDDPLEWDFSTYRDALGFVIGSSFRRVSDPARFHDETCAIVGLSSALPQRRPVGGGPPRVPLGTVLAAVSATMRLLPEQVLARGPARDLFIRAARRFTGASTRTIADWAHVCTETVRLRSANVADDAALLVIERVLGDPRFPGLDDRDLCDQPAWRQYAQRH